jgi:hypothetical protein
VAIQVVFKVVGAVVFYVIGRWLIGLAIRLVSSTLERQRVDPTLLRYLSTVISVTLNVILVVAILGYFGIETTSFAAILAAAGVAIGMAWSGLLANFAAGAFMTTRWLNQNRSSTAKPRGHLRYCAPASSICSAMVWARCSGERTRANGPKLRIQLCSERSTQTSSVMRKPPPLTGSVLCD